MASRIIHYEKLRSIGLFMLGFATILLCVTMLLLVRQNNILDRRLECRAQSRDALDQAIGRGLVAVANEDDVELRVQAKKVIAASDEIGEC